MRADQEIRAAALHAAAVLYGQLAARSVAEDKGDPAITRDEAADHTEVLAKRFERFIKGNDDMHRPGAGIRNYRG
ncbi:hypothetical protein [Streptomyces sp. NPDC001978]|uniref:hypothetical protein n=1 Tax=Streptomyces sp. NPDC001978 TaxID=3364627 RepID=UPI0036A7B34C